MPHFAVHLLVLQLAHFLDFLVGLRLQGLPLLDFNEKVREVSSCARLAGTEDLVAVNYRDAVILLHPDVGNQVVDLPELFGGPDRDLLQFTRLVFLDDDLL